jgi:hypothetical protein
MDIVFEVPSAPEVSSIDNAVRFLFLVVAHSLQKNSAAGLRCFQDPSLEFFVGKDLLYGTGMNPDTQRLGSPSSGRYSEHSYILQLPESDSPFLHLRLKHKGQ